MEYYYNKELLENVDKMRRLHRELSHWVNLHVPNS